MKYILGSDGIPTPNSFGCLPNENWHPPMERWYPSPESWRPLPEDYRPLPEDYRPTPEDYGTTTTTTFTLGTDSSPKCKFCGEEDHGIACLRVKEVEFFDNGKIKRVEYNW